MKTKITPSCNGEHKWPHFPSHNSKGGDGEIKVYQCNQCIAVKVIQKAFPDGIFEKDGVMVKPEERTIIVDLFANNCNIQNSKKEDTK